jgi:hypothetical protein
VSVRAIAAVASCATTIAIAIACVDTARAPTAANEPIRVENGQFHDGAIPDDAGGPKITIYNSANNLVHQGALSRKLTGNAAKGSSAVAVRFADIGTGYWVVPVGVEDPQTDGELTYEVDYDLDRDAPVGDHKLLITAVDLAGHFGPPSEIPITIASRIPSGAVVVTLEWDAPVDLDLVMTTPWGKTLDPKHPSTIPIQPDSGIDPSTPGIGVLDHDSNGGCAIDGQNEESVVFASAPFPGLYHVYADLFDACGRDSARFTLTVRALDDVDAGTSCIVLQKSGEVIAPYDVTGGASPGLFLTDLSFSESGVQCPK